MQSLAASNAELTVDRVWPQHQAVLTLIKDRVEDPDRNSFKWLDLGCGRGQILANLGRVLSRDTCSKIEYVGFDVVQDHCRQAEKFAKDLFASAQIQVCDIANFELYLAEGQRFDAVTLTNTVHEITPEQVAATFVAALCRVNGDGFVFMYDMESLPKLELGAVPWLGKEIERIFHCLLKSAGETTYLPTVSTWPHRTCIGWNLQINRNHLRVPDETLELRRGAMNSGASKLIRELLTKRLLDIHQALTVASRYGSESGEEHADIQRLAYDFWAIARVLGIPLSLL